MNRILLEILCVLASVLLPGVTSASPSAGAEARVGAFDLAQITCVGVEASLTLELRPGCEPTYDQLATDSLLAARGVTRPAVANSKLGNLGDDLYKGANSNSVGREPDAAMRDPKETILDLVAEDDYGLWEVLWRIRSTGQEVSEAKAIETATEAITEMYCQGLVALERRKAGVAVLLSKEEIAAVLSDPDSWREPQAGDVGLFIRATPSGEAAYYS